jgi:hypothetical protein
MKNIKQIREHKVILAEREETEDRKLSSLVRAGLFDSKKLPALKKALDKSADKISGQEKRMLVSLLDSLMDQVLSNQSVYQKVKQNVMKEEYEELDESKLSSRTTKDINDLPNIILLRRRAVRVFPGGGKVVMYWADKINRYIPIPVDPVSTVTRGPNVDGLSESYDDYIKHIYKAYSQHDEDDPEIAQHLANAKDAFQNIPKGIERERASISGRKTIEKAKEIRMISNRKKFGGEQGYAAQAGEFLKSGNRAAALGTLAGGIVGSIARKMAKEELETTRIRMKKMTVSPLTGVRKNVVVREDFRANLEAQRQLDENLVLKALGAAGGATIKYGSKKVYDAGKAISNTISKYKAARAAAAAEKAAKAARREQQLTKIEKSRTRNKDAFAKRNKDAKDSRNLSKNKNKDKNKKADRDSLGATLGSLVSGGDNNSSIAATNSYQTSRREVAKTPGESSFKQARVGDYATRQVKDTQLQRKAFQYQQNENTIQMLKTISEGETKTINFNDGNDISVGYTLAKKIINIYESLNKSNKQAMANMLNESIVNFKKISKFAIDNRN